MKKNNGKKFLSDIKLHSDYLKWKENLGRYETWEEACEDIINGHRQKYTGIDIEEELVSILESMKEMKVFASQRNLQFRYQQVKRSNLRLYNCSVLHAVNNNIFQNVCYLLINGCGVGISLLKPFVDNISNINDRENGTKTFVIEDSIEGWADAFGVLMSSYFVDEQPFPEYSNCKIRFDYSLIRPNGSLISGGFKAPGHEPLKKSLEIIEKFLDNLISTNVNKLRPIHVFDIICHISDCILSGGVRRCLAKGSKVLVKDGTYKNIEDIKIGDMVKTLNGYKTVINTFIQGKQNAIKIIHQSGELQCTPNHKIATILEDGKIIWKMAKDLTENDNLVFCLDSDDRNFTSNLPSFNYIKPRHSTTCKDIIIPKLDNDIAYLIGLIQGDGYVRLTSKSGNVDIAVEYDKPEKVEKILNIIKRFNVNPKVLEPKENNKCYIIRVKSKQLALYFYTHVKQPKTELSIPGFILNSGADIQKSYIAGLFCSDGCFKTRPVQVCVSIYENFLKEIQCLLSKFGIHSFIKNRTYNRDKNWNPIYSLNIIGMDNFNNFKSLVSMSPKSNDKNFIIKYTSNNIIKPINNIQPIKIKKITQSKIVETYDIEVEDEHSFMCEGILVHNSALNMIVDPNDIEMIYAKTGNWRQSNPQRARSNNSVLLLRNIVEKKQFEEIIKLNDGDNDIGFAFANSWFDMFNPCVSSDSLINTPYGLYFPEDLKNNNKITLDSINFDSFGFRQTGVKKLLQIETEYGRKIKVTHEHIMFTDEGLVPACKLMVNDKVIISNNTKLNIEFDYNSDSFKKGYLVGSFLADGNFSEESCQIKFWGKDNHKYHNECIKYIKDLNWNIGKPHKELKEDSEVYSCLNSVCLYNFIKEKDESVINHKRLSKKLLSGDFNYINGLIAGYFDADGTVAFNQKKGNSIRITSIQLENLENLQIALNAIGIYSKIYKDRNKCLNGFNTLPDGKGGSKIYPIQNSHELCITKESIDKFTIINILNEDKKYIINKILNNYSKKFYKQSFEERIVSICELDEFDNVYDCSVQFGIEAFECNGFKVHNCYEISFTPILTDKDLTQITYEELPNFIKENKDMFGIQLCNLTSMNAEKIKNKEDFLRACKDEAILGTLQAGYTSFPYFKNKTEEITKKEALLGVSITGWMNNPKLFNTEWLQEGVKVILETNERLASKLGINKAARTTCVKPEGNLSVIAQTSSGIHPEHSERYFRVMQLNKGSDIAKWLNDNMPFLLEESVWSANNTDYVIFIPIINPTGAMFKNSVQGVKHLDLIKLVQENWILPGTRKELGISPKINHNISSTVILDDKQKIIDYIWENKNSFTAVSFISDYGDKDFNQAPFTSVLNAEEIFEKYGKGAIFISGLIVDGLHYFNNNLWDACDCILDTNIPISGTREQVMLKKYWVTRAKKFAKNYFKNDLKTLVYCLKDVHLYHKWESINREIKEIDFTKVLKAPEYKDISNYSAQACSGQGCTITKI